MLVQISINGCDDSTIFHMELTEAELDFLKRLCRMSDETSTYGCQPTMEYTVNPPTHP